MEHSPLEMSGSAKSRGDTDTSELDAILAKLRRHAEPFARLSPAARAGLLRECMPLVWRNAEDWVRAACEAKGIDYESAASSEEWLGGPMTTLRNVRLLAEALDAIVHTGKPGVDDANLRVAGDGRVEAEVFPTSMVEKALYAGFTATIRFEEGMSRDDVRAKQASFYAQKDPKGGVSLVLGAGNVASIPPMDAFYKMFVEGMVCLVKLNPVNEYLEPFYRKALAPLIDRGYLEFVRGGGAVGKYLVEHADVDDVHITGSDRTFDLIVWGPAGDERERRKRENDPVLTKPISSELGSVTPVILVPGEWSEKELQYVAEYVATMVTNNASCNCNAGKMLVTSKGWAQRDAFLAKVRDVLKAVPARKAYYPGAFDRFKHLTEGREGVERLVPASESELPWTLIVGLDAKAEHEALFTTEPFCPILSEARLDESDPSAFLAAATAFANDRLWGTLSAVLFIDPRTERGAKDALDKAVSELRYGAVGINQWTGLVYGLVTAPWGGHPSSPKDNIQGGVGWVHNTFMFEGIEKLVLRGPFVVAPKPPYFVTHRKAQEVARKVTELELGPSMWKVPSIVFSALQG